MAQEPAVPKALRARRLTLARLFGPAAARRPAPLAASEAAALALAEAQLIQGAPEEVVFLIPLVGPHHVGDWNAVTTRLSATLESLIAQNDGRWRAVICCQEAPPLPADPRICFLPFDDPTPGNDKWRKLARLYEQLAHLDLLRGLAMSFDADDLAHPALVSDLLGAGGGLLAFGHVMDAGTGRVALAGPPTLSLPLRKPFWKLCGSCAARPFDLSLGAEAARLQLDALRTASQHEHRMFPYLARLAGQPLRPLAAPRVLYLLNHGENFGARRGRVSFKARFVERFAVSETEAATLRRTYQV